MTFVEDIVSMRYIFLFLGLVGLNQTIFAQCSSFASCNVSTELQNNTCGVTYSPNSSFQTTCAYQRDGDYALFNLVAGKSYWFTTSETMVGSHLCDDITQAMYLHRPDGTCVEYEFGSVTVCMFYEVPTGAGGLYKLRMQQDPCNDNSCSARIGFQEVSSPQYVGPYLYNSTLTTCSGQSITLGADANDDYLGVDTYWYTGSCGGTLVGTGAMMNVSPTTTTTYYVRNRNRGCNGLLDTYTSCDIITVNVISISNQPSNLTLCPNKNGTLSCTASDGTYQWQYNNAGTWQNVANGTPTGFSYSNPTSGTLTVNVTSPAAANYQFRCVISGSSGCTTPSNTATVTVNHPNTTGLSAGDYLWRGGAVAGDGVTYNWGNAVNWLVYNGPGSFTAPTVRPYSTSNVRIKPAGTCIAGQPTINGAGVVIDNTASTTSNMCKDIVIESGATLTFQQTATVYNRHFHVTGNYSNYGTVFPNDGRIKFYGGNQQIFDYSGSASFYEVEIDASSVTSLSSTNLNVTNSLRLNGVIVTGANRVWLNTNSLDNNSTGVIDGSFGGHIFGNFRRTIQNNSATYRFPVGVSTVLTTGRRLLEFINNGISGVAYLDCSVSSTFKGQGNNTDQYLNSAIAVQSGQVVNYIHDEAEWTLTPSSGPTSGTYGVNLYAQNFPSLLGADNRFIVLKRPDASSTFADYNTFQSTTTIPVNGLAGRVYSSGNGYAQRTGFSSFSRFSIGSVPLALGVELGYFELFCEDEQVHMAFSTLNEKNTSHFKIKTSENGIYFRDSYIIQAAHNSEVETDYDAFLSTPESRYVQLEQVDMDGTNELLKTAYLPDCFTKACSIVPTPDGLYFQIVLSSADLATDVQVFNADGRIVHSGRTKGNENEAYFIDRTLLGNAVYLIRLRNQESEEILRIVNN